MFTCYIGFQLVSNQNGGPEIPKRTEFLMDTSTHVRLATLHCQFEESIKNQNLHVLGAWVCGYSSTCGLVSCAELNNEHVQQDPPSRWSCSGNSFPSGKHHPYVSISKRAAERMRVFPSNFTSRGRWSYSGLTCIWEYKAADFQVLRKRFDN